MSYQPYIPDEPSTLAEKCQREIHRCVEAVVSRERHLAQLVMPFMSKPTYPVQMVRNALISVAGGRLVLEAARMTPEEQCQCEISACFMSLFFEARYPYPMVRSALLMEAAALLPLERTRSVLIFTPEPGRQPPPGVPPA
jgi:hypothetical protein